MTKSEAISQLQEWIDLINKDYFDLQLDKYAEALEMAIEALNQFTDPGKKASAEDQEGDPITSAQPDVTDIYVGDMIYRQAAVDAIDALHDKPNAWLDYAVDAVMALPSAQPEKRTIKRTGTHACDCISREAAIVQVNKVIWDDAVAHDVKEVLKELPAAQPELIEKVAYIRGFEQGRTQGMIDAQGGKK